MILILLAYLAGVLTIVSPCILPVLPFVFARADRPFVKSGLPLLLGMAATFAGVAVLGAVGGAWVVSANDYARYAALALMAKAERIKEANAAPPRISDDPEFFQCRWCPSRAICHGGQPALRNCRTCIYASPVSGGQWDCAFHYRLLTPADQRARCPNHLYLPSLVPGEQIDVDETAETVTYRMPDGSTWVDGGRS